MKNILRILLILAIIGVPCGTHAAKKDLTDNTTYNTPSKSFGAADANDTELYDILSGTEPTLGPLNIGGTGDSWLQLYNNTTLVDDYTSKYGIRFYNGSLYQVIDGTGSLIGSGGTTITWQTTDPDTTDPSGLYINTTDGDAFAIDTGVGMSTWATTYTTAPASESCIGWDEPSCTLSTVPTSAYLELSATMATKWTATEDGTAVSINAYTKGIVTNTEATVLYKDISGTITLIAKGAVTSVVNGFVGDSTLVAESGQSLDFSSGDVLYYGISYNGGVGVGREDSGGSGVHSNTSGSVAPATITLSLTSGRKMALGFKYE